MFVLYSKLKALKAALKSINWRKFRNIYDRIRVTRTELQQIQAELLNQQSDASLVALEKRVAKRYYFLASLEESALK